MVKTERKGPTARIAAAVFVGVLAALIVYHIPGWYEKREADRADQRKTERDLRLYEMKPMDYVARCGSLVEDKTTSEGDGMAFRDETVQVTMPDGMKKKVTAEWTTADASEGYDPSNWSLDSLDGLDLTSGASRVLIESNYPCTVASPGDVDDDLYFLTPKEVTSACGKPTGDRTKDDGTTITRYLQFDMAGPAGSKKGVTAVFSGSGGPSTPPDWTLRYFGGLTIGSSDAAIEKWYPCLKTAAAAAP